MINWILEIPDPKELASRLWNNHKTWMGTMHTFTRVFSSVWIDQSVDRILDISNPI
jgi:hypothetical protein